jgi:hypothetical protein
MILRPLPDEGARGEGRRPVPRDVPRLRAAKFTSRAGVSSRRAYSAGTPDLGEDDFEALPTGGLRLGPRQLVRRAFRIATVADSFRKLVAHLPVHPSGPCRQRGYDATAGACYAATSGVTVSGGSPVTAAAVGAPERERGAPVCFPENPTVCYRPMPRRYGLGASDYGVGGGNRNDRKTLFHYAPVGGIGRPLVRWGQRGPRGHLATHWNRSRSSGSTAGSSDAPARRGPTRW